MKKLMLLAGMSAVLGVGSLLGASIEGRRRPIKRPKSKQQKQSRKQNRKKK